MTSVGETLRRERLKRNLELDQIAQELKISVRMLEAIETEKFDRLPGGVFSKSFIRQYAQLLELDADDVVSQARPMLDPLAGNIVITTAVAPEGAAPSIHVPRVEEWEGYGERRFSWSSWMPAAAMVIVAMLVCSGIYSWWQRNRQVTSAQAPAAPTAAAVEPVTASAPPPPPPVPAAVVEQPPAASPEPAPAISLSPPAATAPPDGASAAASNPTAGVRVAMTAEEEVWVSARADGKYLFSGVLEAHQTRTVEAHDTLLIRLGNAGGLTVTLNGKPVGALGAKGQPRTVQFTPGGFQIVAAPKPSLPL